MQVKTKSTQLISSMTLKQRKIFAAFMFIFPAAILIFVFRFYPILYSIYYSFFDYNLLRPAQSSFTGLSNYSFAFFADPDFYNSLWITILFAILKVVLQLIPGFFLALFLRMRFKLTGVLRTAVLAPTVTSMVVVSVIWSLLLNPHSGLFNSALSFLGINAQPFLTSSKQALPSLLAMMIWKDMGFVVIVFLTGLLDIPQTLYEQASIDGATTWKKITKITLPLMKRTFLFLATMMTIWSFKVFTPIYLTTEGGPSRSTNVLVYYIYENAFTYMDMGYALALTIILLFLVSMFSAVHFKVFNTDE